MREIRLREYLDQMARRVFEVDASTVVMVVDLPLLGLVWVGPIHDFSNRKPFDDNVEQVVGDAESVVLWLDLVDRRFRELDECPVAELDVRERPHDGASGRSNNQRKNAADADRSFETTMV
ncbi:hypothetical protein [Rhodococcus sp. 1168]|uniref:hypothetical protein n=1 Tax=Rhodococcus sp. 1168 TaxID=2018041 RepID=UPI001594C13B